MANTKHGIIKATPSLPSRDLLYPIAGRQDFSVGWPAFGSDTCANNLTEARKHYSHSAKIPRMTFEEPTTADSLAVVAWDPSTIKKNILDPRLQLGRYVCFQDGIFVNPPKDASGNPIIDERILKRYLNGVNPIEVSGGKIYVVQNSGELRDFGFAERGTLKEGVVQSSEEFSRSGLAKVLEHNSTNAVNLGKISSAEYYPNGVRVLGFVFDSAHILRVAGLDSDRDDDGLDVGGDDWDDDEGCVFGVRRDIVAEGNAPKDSA